MTRKSEEPLITYITVVFNNVEKIERCILSVINQNYENIQYIIIDGMSTDGTREIINKYVSKVDIYISESDRGLYDAMNKGLKYAKGDLICFMNSDDECIQGVASKVADMYVNSGADMICGGRVLNSEDVNVFEVVYPRYLIKNSCFRYLQLFHQSLYVTQTVFAEIGVFDWERYPLLADWVWESKAVDCGYKTLLTDEPFARFSYGGSSCRGIIQRDEEWLDWIQSTFDFLSRRDAAFFLFTMDRGRHLLCDAGVCNKVAKKYVKNRNFMKTYYETQLSLCVDMCTDIIAYGNVDERIQIIRIDFQTMLDNLCVSDNSEINDDMLNNLATSKEYINKLYRKSYYNREMFREYSIGTKLLRVMTLETSRLMGWCVPLARCYYPFLRLIWVKVFNGRYVNN